MKKMRPERKKTFKYLNVNLTPVNKAREKKIKSWHKTYAAKELILGK